MIHWAIGNFMRDEPLEELAVVFMAMSCCLVVLQLQRCVVR